jgi:import inner membrane translocase subunit TIM50
LFREASLYESGKVIKDSSKLNRPISRILVIDWQKDAISKQPENAIVIPRWTGDTKDTLLIDLIPVLKHFGALKDDYRTLLAKYESHDGKTIAEKYKSKETPPASSFWDYFKK